MKKNNGEKYICRKKIIERKKRKREMASRRKVVRKKRGKRRRENTEEPVGTPPLELEEGGPIDEFNPLEKQSNSVCS